MKLRLFLGLGLLLSGPSTAVAQCQLCAQDVAGDATASRKGETPLRVDIETQLDFSRVAVELDPASGARWHSGGSSISAAFL